MPTADPRLDMTEATDTCACPCCEVRGADETGGQADCPVPQCYRGRISGYGWEVVIACDGGQRAAVDAWLSPMVAHGSVSPGAAA